MSDTYQIKFKRPGHNSVFSRNVKADSASEAREKVKSDFNGNVTIVSCVKK